MSSVKQPSLDITRFFTGYCPMSGANIQAGKTEGNERAERNGFFGKKAYLQFRKKLLGQNGEFQ